MCAWRRGGGGAVAVAAAAAAAAGALFIGASTGFFALAGGRWVIIWDFFTH
jgi:hypothetical protein